MCVQNNLALRSGRAREEGRMSSTDILVRIPQKLTSKKGRRSIVPTCTLNRHTNLPRFASLQNFLFIFRELKILFLLSLKIAEQKRTHITNGRMSSIDTLGISSKFSKKFCTDFCVEHFKEKHKFACLF